MNLCTLHFQPSFAMKKENTDQSKTTEKKFAKTARQLIFSFDHFMVAVISLALTAFLYFLFSFNIGFLNPVRRAFADFSMSDVYYSILWQGGDVQKSQYITLVDIDTLYFRKDIAQVIKEVDQYQPKVVGIDIIFEGKKFNEEGDVELAEALENNFENKVLAYKLLEPDAGLINFKHSLHSYCIDNTPFIQEGYTNVLYSEAGTTLRMFSIFRKENGTPCYSFPAQIYNKYIENYEEIDTTQHNDRHINFDKIEFPVIRFDSIAQHPELIKDHIVLIGTMHEESDMHYSPIGKEPGLKIQAYSLQSLIDQYEIKTLDEGSTWILAFLATYITGILQFLVIYALRKKDTGWSIFLAESVAFTRLFTFFLLAMIAYIAFLIYIVKDVFIGTTAILIAAVLTGEARGIYAALLKCIVKYLKNRNLPYQFVENRLLYKKDGSTEKKDKTKDDQSNQLEQNNKE